MAYQRDITEDDKVFYDTDQALEFIIADGDPTTEQLAAGDYVPIDISGYSLIWVLKRKATSEVALIEKRTAGGGISITGTWDADPTANTQRVRVLIDDTDTYGPEVSPVQIVAPGTYAHALKRLDTGAETIYTWGSFELILAAAWE